MSYGYVYFDHWVKMTICLLALSMVKLFISAWASALLVLRQWAMRRPQIVGRATCMFPTPFCLITKTKASPDFGDGLGCAIIAMKIIQLITSSGWGGVEQYVYDLSVAMRGDGHEVIFMARDYPQITARYANAGFEVHICPIRKFIDYRSPRELARLLDCDEPVIVHTHNFRDAKTAVKAREISKNRRTSILVTRHLVKPGSNSNFNRYIYSNIDAVVFVSRLALDTFLSGKPAIDRSKLRMIHNSICSDLSNFGQSYSDSGYVKILYHGRVAEEKGIDTLLKAVSKLKDLPIVLDIVGGGDGHYMQNLILLARRHGIDSFVKWCGHVENVHPYIEKCDIGVYPSRTRESSFGLSVIEYMAHARPVITTDSGAQSEYISHGVDGFIVKPDCSEVLAETIRRLAESPQLRRNVGENARQKFAKTLAYPIFHAKMSALYNELIGKGV